MSHSSTIKLFDHMGKDFDSKVLQWKSDIEREVMPYLPLTEVRSCKLHMHALHILYCNLEFSYREFGVAS